MEFDGVGNVMEVMGVPVLTLCSFIAFAALKELQSENQRMTSD